eukprot:gene14826-biopygen5145
MFCACAGQTRKACRSGELEVAGTPAGWCARRTCRIHQQRMAKTGPVGVGWHVRGEKCALKRALMNTLKNMMGLDDT